MPEQGRVLGLYSSIADAFTDLPPNIEVESDAHTMLSAVVHVLRIVSLKAGAASLQDMTGM